MQTRQWSGIYILDPIPLHVLPPILGGRCCLGGRGFHGGWSLGTALTAQRVSRNAVDAQWRIGALRESVLHF